MRILQIANKGLYPPDGGSLAILNSAKGFIANNFSVYLLNMITHKHNNNSSSNANDINIIGIKVNTKISLFKLLNSFLFSKKAYIAQRFISKEFENKLVELLNSVEFNFVQFEGLYTLQYIDIIRENFKGKIIYRPHNMEYLIWERNSNESNSFIKKFYYKSLSKRLKNLELRLLNTYDYILPIAENDADNYKKLGNQKPCLVTPFGIDIEKFQHLNNNTNKAVMPSINYIGALDWIPNQKGILWFVNKCFPLILNSYPGLKLYIAGRNASESFKTKLKHKNIQFVGEVIDAYSFIKNPGPIIVPLFSGSGMRVKIIESMALKKAVVATSIAAEGINCEHKKEILISNQEKDFAESVISLLNNFDYQTEIGENAFNFVKQNFDFKKIARNTLNFIN